MLNSHSLCELTAGEEEDLYQALMEGKAVLRRGSPRQQHPEVG